MAQMETVESVAQSLVSLGKNAERIGHVAPSITPHAQMDSKQKQRENLKELAQGHKLQSEQEQDFIQTM